MTNRKQNAVVLLSGGIDSTTTLAMAQKSEFTAGPVHGRTSLCQLYRAIQSFDVRGSSEATLFVSSVGKYGEVRPWSRAI